MKSNSKTWSWSWNWVFCSAIFHKYFINCFSENLLQFFQCPPWFIVMNFDHIHFHLSPYCSSFLINVHGVTSHLTFYDMYSIQLSNGVAKIQSKWSSHIFDWTYISFYWIFASHSTAFHTFAEQNRRGKKINGGKMVFSALWWSEMMTHIFHLTISYPFWNLFSVFLVRAKIFLLFTIYSVFLKTWTFMKIWNCFSLANLNEHGHCSDANSECPSFSQIFLSSTILWMWIAVNVSSFLFIYSYSHILGVNFILIWIFMYSTLLLCSRTIVINFCGFFPSKFIFNFNFVYIFSVHFTFFFLRRRRQTFRVKKLIFRVRCHHQFYVIARFELLVFSNRLSWVHTEFY